jgi:hypothetical protein
VFGNELFQLGTKEGVSKDLAAMEAAGIGRVFVAYFNCQKFGTDVRM